MLKSSKLTKKQERIISVVCKASLSIARNKNKYFDSLPDSFKAQVIDKITPGELIQKISEEDL